MTEERDYADLVRRVEALSSRGIDVQVAAAIGGLPVHRLSVRGGPEPACRLLLTGGVHGDEPSGVDPDPEADAEEPLSRGVYAVASSWGTKGLAPYVLTRHSPHVLIFETPTSWSLDARVEAHHQALSTVRAHYCDGRTPKALDGGREAE